MIQKKRNIATKWYHDCYGVNMVEWCDALVSWCKRDVAVQIKLLANLLISCANKVTFVCTLCKTFILKQDYFSNILDSFPPHAGNYHNYILYVLIETLCFLHCSFALLRVLDVFQNSVLSYENTTSLRLIFTPETKMAREQCQKTADSKYLHSCSATIDFYSDWTKPVSRQGPLEWYICFAFVTKAQICNMSLVLLLLFSTDRLSRSLFAVCVYCFDVKERYRITLLHNNKRMILYWSVYYHITYENSPMNSWDGWKNMYAVSKNGNIGIFV